MALYATAIAAWKRPLEEQLAVFADDEDSYLSPRMDATVALMVESLKISARRAAPSCPSDGRRRRLAEQAAPGT